MKRYEQFPHTADIGVRVFGRTIEELFANAAFAMFDIAADLEGISGDIVRDVDLRGATDEDLLVSWLDELLYDFYTKKVIYYKFDVACVSGGRLKARAFGRPVSANPNRLKTEIKAATYSDLLIKRSPEGYSAEIIFDV